ncbi:hypothetical protein B0H17DRAFT_1141496 [Mycena rosella]|uniref:Uncharacterized protein n=1 Tax=Mycena rosella TaxID=1033263 RepID=A0AAD7G8Z5_MYCRO|nr:hypothetical protein B0H17DRAFT_1141496 [Mycena rosella]
MENLGAHASIIIEQKTSHKYLAQRTRRPNLSPQGYSVVRATHVPASAKYDHLADILDPTGTGLQPATPPQKAPKRSQDDTRREIPRGERASPANRYAGKGGRRDPSPTPARLNPLSLVAYNYDPEDDESPIEDHSFFYDSPSVTAPSPSVSAPSPSVSAPSPSASAPSPSVSAPSPSASTPSPSAATLSPPQSPSLTAMPALDDDPMDDLTLEPAFEAPTRAAWLAAVPTFRDENPHRPSPAHDPANPQALTHWTSFQSNDPMWNAPVMPDHVVLENMSDETTDAVRANPGNYLAVTMFCSGVVLNKKYKNMHSDALGILEEIAGKGKVTLIRPMAKDKAKEVRRGLTAKKLDKFIPPIALIARCTDEQARADLTGQGTFGSTRALGFHVTLFDIACLSWAVGFFKTDINDSPDVTACRLCLAVYDGINKSQKLSSLVDRATQGGSRASRERRTLDFALTFEGRFLPHNEDPVYVLFAKPCTKNAKLWDEIRAAMRTTYTKSLEAFIPHANTASGQNICADCKLDCHPKYNCMFTARDKAWWGPLNLASALRDVRGGEDSDDEDEGDCRGAPRGRAARGFRLGSRSRGYR